jgi:arginyl-tRNA synthetase
MQDRERNIVFDWDKALAFEGNSGPYIQYAFVRAKKIYSEEQISAIGDTPPLSPFDKTLIKTLAEMESIIEQVATTYKPHHLALYAYKLATEFNSFYVHTPKIREEQDENVKKFRFTLVHQTAKQLELAFELLGIKMPSEM